MCILMLLPDYLSESCMSASLRASLFKLVVSYFHGAVLHGFAVNVNVPDPQ